MSGFDRLRNADWLWPAVIAVLAAVFVCLQLDAAGDHPGGWEGPGITVDEAFNVAQGVQLVDRLMAGDFVGFRQLDAQFPDHPPLGRLWIGVCHELAFVIAPPVERGIPYSITCARLAPALAFALTVWLVGWITSRWYGRLAGLIAALSLVLMPRTFGHAHLAALESCINLAYAAVVLYLADRWPTTYDTSEEVMRSLKRFSWWRPALVGGLLFGLALLTKIQAVLLTVPVALWVLWRFRIRGVLLLSIWGLLGLAVLFAGWPYLQSAPVDHLLQYLGRTTDRSVIQVWYGGETIADRDVPWHYPWVIWATTVPVGLHLCGIRGVWSALRRGPATSRAFLVVACTFFPLIVFSIPGIAVYDGERLFSVSYPLWSVMIGCGAAELIAAAHQRWSSRLVSLTAAVLIAAQAYGTLGMAPCWLSYYNLAVVGLRGAERLGLPVTYWGDGITRGLLDEVAARVPVDARIAVVPVLHPAQWHEILRQSPALRRRRVELIPLGAPGSEKCEFLLFFPRREYLPPEMRGQLDSERLLLEVRREGVLLAGLYRQQPDRPQGSPPPAD